MLDSRSTEVSRRHFARVFALGGSAALLGPRIARASALPPLPPTPPTPTAAFWGRVREQFLMPPELSVLNAANLCPSSAPVLQTMYDFTRRLDREPVPTFRNQMHEVKEATRRTVAEFLRVTPDEIVLTRNTSEANNLVSSGLDLRSGDEVVVFADNHPSNNQAWREKAKRFGYGVVTVPQVNPHPGPEYYVEAFSKALAPQTKVLAFTHVSSTVGDVFPAAALCRLARERGVLSVVDGASSFGLLDVDLKAMDPDFYSGSAHKWPCGPKEVGVLFINTRSQAKIWPSIYSAYPGATGISRTFEGMGQRDEPAIQAFGEAIRFLMKIGQKEIEAYSRELTRGLIEGLKAIEGVRLWTSTDPSRSAAIVSFQPAGLDAGKVASTLERDGIVCATRIGADRPGIRFSPHFYNSPEDVDRGVAAIAKYVKTGL